MFKKSSELAYLFAHEGRMEYLRKVIVPAIETGPTLSEVIPVILEKLVDKLNESEDQGNEEIGNNGKS